MEVTAAQIVEDIHLIKNSLTKLETRLFSLHTALTGSDITKDGGLIGRIIKPVKNKAMGYFLRQAINEVEKTKNER